jgi:hypothetical protein
MSYRGQSTAVEDTFVGVRFREETNLTLCATGGTPAGKGEPVIVELEHGPAYGVVERSPMPVFKPCQKSSAPASVAAADDERSRGPRQQVQESRQALLPGARARARPRDEGVQGRLHPLGGQRATFYFTAERRVDFRQLVRDLQALSVRA